MGYGDYSDAWLRDLTRERRADRDQRRYAEWVARGKTIYARSVRPTAEFVASIVATPSARDRAGTLRRRLRKAGVLEALFNLQDYRCCYCPSPIGRDATVEHVVPKAHGGKDHRNILLACLPCNARKANRAPHPCELIFLAAINARLDGPVRSIAA